MKLARIAVSVFLLFTSTVVAQPFVERPVSTPVFGPAEYNQYSPAIASNGTDFLVVWMDSRPASQVFAARFTKTGEILDRTGIRVSTSGYGEIVGVFWIGNAYVVLFWSQPSSSLQVVRINSDGEIIDGPRKILENVTASRGGAASNGSRIVVAYGTPLGSRRLAVLDANAYVVKDVGLGLTLAGWGPLVVSNGSKFLVVASPSSRMSFIALDENGDLTGESGAIVHAIIGAGATVASDGNDYIVLFADASDGRTYVQRVSASAQPLELKALPFGWMSIELSHAAAMWTGQSYLVAATDLSDPEQKLNSFRLTRLGDLAGGLTALTTSGTPGFVNAPALASNGADIGLTWASGVQLDPSGFNVAAEILSIDGTPRTPPRFIESANEQLSPSIATTGSIDLVAWAEGDGIFASRLTQFGTPLDGRGIRISVGGRDPRVVYDATSGTFVIAWIDGNELRARRIDASGMLSAQEFVIADCAMSFDVTADASGVTAATGTCGSARIAVSRVSLAGITGSPLLISPPQVMTTSPRISSNGNELLVVWTALQPDYGFPISEPMFRGSIYAARLTSSLWLLDTPPILVSGSDVLDNRDPRVASDGADFLVAWETLRGDDGHQIHVRYVSAEGALLNGVPSDDGLELATGWALPQSIAWDGIQYAIAFAEATSQRIALTHVGRRPTDPLPNDRIALTPVGLPQSGASLLSRGNGRIAAVYARLAIEPEYGSVMRVFAADAPSRRIRTVRHR